MPNILETANGKSAYNIVYDVNPANERYEDLVAAITTFGSWWRQTTSSWVVITNKDARSILSSLQPFLNDRDRIFISKLDSEFEAFGITSEERNWSNNHII